MKKICLILIALCAIASSSLAQTSKSMKNLGNLYEKQVDVFFVDVFDTLKTGNVMAATARAEMEEAIYQEYLTMFIAWAKWSRKYEGEKPFQPKLKGAKDYEKESAELMTQFSKIMNNFVDERLIWTEAQLKEMLTRERLQPYITPVADKFADRTKALLQKLKSTSKKKK